MKMDREELMSAQLLWNTATNETHNAVSSSVFPFV